MLERSVKKIIIGRNDTAIISPTVIQQKKNSLSCSRSSTQSFYMGSKDNSDWHSERSPKKVPKPHMNSEVRCLFCGLRLNLLQKLTTRYRSKNQPILTQLSFTKCYLKLENLPEKGHTRTRSPWTFFECLKNTW